MSEICANCNYKMGLYGMQGWKCMKCGGNEVKITCTDCKLNSIEIDRIFKKWLKDETNTK